MDKHEEKFARYLDEDSQIFGFNSLAEPKTSRKDTLIRLDALEMLEAEFHNQRLLPFLGQDPQTGKALFYVAKQAALESSYWRWRARRIGLMTGQCAFSVKIPAYLIKLTQELLVSVAPLNERRQSDTIFLDKILHAINPTNDYKSIQNKLHYLDKFSQLVSNNQPANAANRYQRGLELILKVLTSSSKAESTNQANQLQLYLPISREEFQIQVQDFLSNNS